jgi:uncharacterized protein DUF929
VAVAIAIMAVVALIRPRLESQASSEAGSSAIAVQQVPVEALDAVGAGSDVTPPKALPAGTPPLERDGKPQVLYIGAEYCPFCAAQRWPLIVALSRFGTFQDLGATASSASDAFPNTQTFSFHGSTYTSEHLSFAGIETETNTGVTLDQPTPDQQALLQRYDGPPYTTAAGSIPFLMIGNRFVAIGASFDPSVLRGMTRDEIVAALSDPASEVAREVNGSANTLTAAICQTTGDEPQSVCADPTIAQIASTLPRSG